MANFGLYDRPFIKIAGALDYCYTCCTKKCKEKDKHPSEVIAEETGKLRDQLVLYIRRSGVDTCICQNCLKELSNELLPKEENIKEEVVKSETEEKTEIAEDKKELKTKKKK